MKNFGAGELNQRITFQRRAPGTDALGQAAGAWVDLVVTPTMWAKAEPLRGRELFAAGQVQSEMSVRFIVRWRGDIRASDRVLWRGVPHDIVGDPIDVDGRRLWQEVMCATGARDGR